MRQNWLPLKMVPSKYFITCPSFFFSDQESGNFNFSKQTEFVQLIYTSNLQDFFCEMVTVNKQSW